MKGASPQAGFAMLLSMVFLALLSGLGANALQHSAVEQRLSANIQHHNTAFRTAESGLAIGLGDAGMAIALEQTTTPAVHYRINVELGEFCDAGALVNCGDDWPEHSRADVLVTTRYEGGSDTPPPGFSIDSDFATHHFIIRGEASHGPSHADLARGFRRLGPRSNH